MNTPNYAQPYYWYYATREEALKWPIAPGNMLTFKDPDGKHYYEKSLGWSPSKGVKFTEFSLQENAPVTTSTPTSSPVEIAYEQPKQTDIDAEIKELKEQILDLAKSIKNSHQYYNKKGDNKQ